MLRVSKGIHKYRQEDRVDMYFKGFEDGAADHANREQEFEGELLDCYKNGFIEGTKIHKKTENPTIDMLQDADLHKFIKMGYNAYKNKKGSEHVTYSGPVLEAYTRGRDIAKQEEKTRKGGNTTIKIRKTKKRRNTTINIKTKNRKQKNRKTENRKQKNRKTEKRKIEKR